MISETFFQEIVYFSLQKTEQIVFSILIILVYNKQEDGHHEVVV